MVFDVMFPPASAERFDPFPLMLPVNEIFVAEIFEVKLLAPV
jgi:hypothetical protein